MEWIKVDDRLPSHKQIIIAFGKYTNNIQENPDPERSVHACKYLNWGPDKTSWLVLDESCCGVNELLEVTHWAPLPEQPKDSDTDVEKCPLYESDNCHCHLRSVEED